MRVLFPRQGEENKRRFLPVCESQDYFAPAAASQGSGSFRPPYNRSEVVGLAKVFVVYRTGLVDVYQERTSESVGVSLSLSLSPL